MRPAVSIAHKQSQLDELPEIGPHLSLVIADSHHCLVLREVLIARGADDPDRQVKPPWPPHELMDEVSALQISRK